MPAGQLVRKDDVVSESLTAKGTVKMDRTMLESLTGAGGPLSNGGIPDVKTATPGGGQALLALVDSSAGAAPKAKTKPAKKDKAEKKSEVVMPLTPLELGPQ